MWNKCLEQWRCLSRFYHYLMQLWVTADGHWSRVTKSRVTSDHQQWPQLHYLVIKPRWTVSLWEAFYFAPLRRSGHRQCTLFNDALQLHRSDGILVTAFSNRISVKGHNYFTSKFKAISGPKVSNTLKCVTFSLKKRCEKAVTKCRHSCEIM